MPQLERVVVSVEDPIYKLFALLSTSLHVFVFICSLEFQVHTI